MDTLDQDEHNPSMLQSEKISNSRSITREPHIFRLTQSFLPGGGVNIVIVSFDGSIVHILQNDDYWNSEFKCGENRIYVKGYWDLLDNNIYLGERVNDQSW